MKPKALPGRIVSLVPSLTEALFALGLGDRVVGVTDWCVHPAAAVAGLPRVGGTKTPDLQAILALRPELVIANREENTQRDVRRLEAAGLAVWVTYPRRVDEAVALLRELAELGGRGEEIAAVVEPIEATVRKVRTAPLAHRTRLFCPIWKHPWMSVGADTYADDLLSLCGAENVFSRRDERRYPIVRQEDIVRAAPEVVLLPDEPYAFGPRDVSELAKLPLPASTSGRIHLIDGTLVTWYGPRIRTAVETLRVLIAGPGEAG